MEVNTILNMDALEGLKTLETESIDMCCTSPPYWGLRNYSVNGQLGLEATPEEYIDKMVRIFREVRRVLKKEGTLWLNMGDSYAAGNKDRTPEQAQDKSTVQGTPHTQILKQQNKIVGNLKPKDLCGIPWMLAFALRADGWYLRQDIIWAKPNPMPESVTDRCTKSHEYIFLLTKAAHYYYDADAIREPISESYANDKRPHGVLRQRFYKDSKYVKAGMIKPLDGEIPKDVREETRNKRSVWTINTQPFPESHFAVFPERLVEPCIKAGTSEKGCCSECGKAWERVVEMTQEYRELLDSGKAWRTNEGKPDSYTNRQEKGHPSQVPTKNITIGWQPTCKCFSETEINANLESVLRRPCIVLDPFTGAGTTPLVARKLGRNYIGIELSRDYIEMAEKRLYKDLGMFV